MSCYAGYKVILKECILNAEAFLRRGDREGGGGTRAVRK